MEHNIVQDYVRVAHKVKFVDEQGKELDMTHDEFLDWLEEFDNIMSDIKDMEDYLHHGYEGEVKTDNDE